MSNQKIRLATASPATRATLKDTLAHLHEITRHAAAQKADILLFPEAYLGGYPRGSYFGCKIGERTTEGRDEFVQYFKSAVDLGDTVGNGAGAGDAWVRRQLASDNAGTKPDAPQGVQRGDGTREELERIARETGVFIVTGLIEKAGGSLYCTAVYVCPQLGIIGKRRKTQPTGTERLIWAQGSPATLKAVSTTIRGVRVNLGAAICWESYMPLLRQALYQQNINLYLAPTADGRDTWLSTMRTIGLEGRCFVLSSNMCVRGGGLSGSNEKQASQQGAAAGGADAAQARTDAGERDREEEVGVSTSAAAPLNGIPESHPRGGGRRNSCFTEEGFEIALPGAGGAATTQSVTAVRRRSVLDENGHEIVLCGQESSAAVIEEDEEADTIEAGDGKGVNGQGDSTATAAVGKEAVKSVQGSEFVSRGGSCIVSPFGDVLAGPQWEDDEGIIYADVDFEDCIRGRLDLDVGGSYSRNDSFRFEVQGLNLDPLPYH